jgi:hypothetical protein
MSKPRKKSVADLLRERGQATGRNGKPRRPPDPLPEHLRGDAWEPPVREYQGDPEPDPEPLGTLLRDVSPERVSWLWPGRIPRGKLTILDGDPGLGKSVLTMDLAARVSAGLGLPDGTPCPAAGVVIMNAEDGLADTILPRLLAAGADPARVLALQAVPDQSGLGVRPVALPADLGHLRRAVDRVGAALVIVDPLMAYLGSDVNAHRDQDVRRALHPLSVLAGETAAAVIVVRHLNKLAGGNPLYRGGGSIGIIGAARSGLLVARDPDNTDRRVLASTKCNLARLPPSLTYALEPTPDGALRVGWQGECAYTAESLLAAPRDDEERGELQEAVEVLRTILCAGSVPANDAKSQARKAGVAERTLQRAKTALGVRSRLLGFGRDGKWYWSLPPSPDADAPEDDRGCQT